MKNLFGKTVYAYTRKQAIADGVLIDVTRFASACGITIPTAITYNLFYSALVPQGAAEEQGEDNKRQACRLVLRF